MEKVLSYLKTKEMQKVYIVIGILAMFAIIFAVKPFATDGYEDIGDRATLDQRVATAITNGQTELYIDYSGEDFENMKSWFKEDFKYDKLINYTDEFSIYNYNGAKYSYWSYGDKKRVKVTISYKLNAEQIAAVNSFADNYIETNGLRNMSQYDAIKNIHDYLVNNYVYTSDANNLYNMINNGQANCYGYTMLNYVLLNKVGIPVRTTYGAMNESHIWNAVQLNGQWYYEDVTWDTVDKGTSYFLISTEQIQKTHKIYGNFIPNCPSTYVDVSAKTDENETTETPTVSGNVPTEEDPIITENTEIPNESIEDNIVEEDVVEEVEESTGEVEEPTEEVEESTEDIKAEENTTITDNNSNEVEDESIVEESTPSDEKDTDNNSDSNNTSDSSNPSVPSKETKIQKLVRLLKQLRNIKKIK